VVVVCEAPGKGNCYEVNSSSRARNRYGHHGHGAESRQHSELREPEDCVADADTNADAIAREEESGYEADTVNGGRRQSVDGRQDAGDRH
jgi:hypothetical protein